MQEDSVLQLTLDGETLRHLAVLILFTLAFSIYAFADSGATYKERCAACHGVDGAGQTMLGKNLKPRSLASPDVQRLSDDELFTIISKGKGKMPAFERKLSHEQIRELVKHIRAFKR